MSPDYVKVIGAKKQKERTFGIVTILGKGVSIMTVHGGVMVVPHEQAVHGFQRRAIPLICPHIHFVGYGNRVLEDAVDGSFGQKLVPVIDSIVGVEGDELAGGLLYDALQ
jgi:hypothetical protein